MDQMISFLDGVVLKGDHSFKVIDHMAKVNGVSTFFCLYTLLNEYEEIRLQVLGHSKKVDHLAPQFIEMMETYRKLGMKLPELFYTDNVTADQSFLGDVIPSLLKDVVPIPATESATLDKDPFASLSTVNLPANVQIIILNNCDEVNNACQKLIDEGGHMGKIH
ncbi:hypothetical protein ABG067_007854, partial [Albugo candida]